MLCCAVAGYGDLAPKTETGRAFVAEFIFYRYSIGATATFATAVRDAMLYGVRAVAEARRKKAQ
jgi:hypothetical protein